MPLITRLAALFFILAAGAVIGHWAFPNEGAPAVIQKIHPVGSEYQLINPLLGVEVSSSENSAGYQSMEKKLSSLIDKKIKDQEAEVIAVYFRDLEPVRWMGINENLGFDPGSLLKVPVMIAYLKMAESDQGILTRKVYYSNQRHTEIYDNSGPSVFKTLKSDRFYTTKELIRAMIVESDNSAKDILIDEMPKKPLVDIFAELGIPFPETAGYTISAKTYSTFFRILYNSTFLSREMSEVAMKLLSEASFKDGIAAGIPAGIPVAHKFGQHGAYIDGQLTGLELHDCGIIYQSARNYLLCVMTKGNNFETLKGVIRDVSQLTYNLFNENLGK